MSINSNFQLTTVAVAGGTGGFGKVLVRALIDEQKYKIKVLYRSESTPSLLHEEFKSKEVTMVPVDYSSVANLTEALTGVQIVLCVFGFEGLLESQLNLLQASQDAKVHKFVPSEYGVDGEAEKYETFADKGRVRKAIEKTSLKYTYYNNGFFLEYCLSPHFDMDLTKDQLKMIGDGEANLSVTSMYDVASYVAKSLTNEKTDNRNVNVLGETTSLNKMIQFAEQLRGKKYQVERVPVSEILAIPDLHDPTKLLEHAYTMIKLEISKGGVYIEQSSFDPTLAGPNFTTLKIEEYIRSLLA